MKVLVTGATGFLGSHLVAKLTQQGYNVRALARKSSNIDYLEQQNVEIVYGNLKDRDSLQRAIKGIDIVYHAAAAVNGTLGNTKRVP